MGPQPFGCGRPCSIKSMELNVPCFNGAATFRLRKAIIAREELCTVSCFNGAATFRLRKVTVGGAVSRRCKLQWGRNLSVAEGSRPPHSDERRNSLQWGRNLSVAEGAARCPAGSCQVDASMGPQPFGCGRRSQPSAPAWCKPLQWGRNLSVAEGGLSGGAYRSRRRRFNGAATFRLRKVALGLFRRSAAGLLQWGRNLSVAEGAHCGIVRREIRLLQWGRNLSVAEGS